MTWIIGLLTSRIAGPAASIVAVILLALCVGQCTRAARAEGDVQKMQISRDLAQASLATCRTNTDTLKAANDRQNAAVAALEAAGVAMVAQSDKAASQARALAESYRRQARGVLAAEPRGGDLCSAAGDLIERHVR